MRWSATVIVGAVLFIVLVVVLAFAFSMSLRRYLRRERTRRPADEFAPPRPPSENQAAFLTASMQSVIQRLKEQEKELERLHRVEKERAEQTERLSAAVTRNMPTGLLLINAAELITMANPAAKIALGVGALAYRRFSEVLGAESELTRLLTACLREARTFQREEVQHRIPSGEPRHLGVTISPVFQPPGDPKGKVTGAVCLLSDLTELTLLQEQMRLRESLAALGEMSAGIAHEFKNALATISGYAQMIRSEAAQPELAESASKIEDQTRALTHVVAEFLRFARPMEVMSDDVNLQPLVERVVDEMRQAMPQVQFSAAGEFTVIPGDEGLLRQVFLNLARNAGESVQGGASPGRVTLTGAVEENSGRRVQRISAADNGPGIPPQDLPKIFLPFFTTKIDGTGLGLALVQKIVVQHGGTVQARNLPEGGAEFILWLPLRREKPQAVDSALDGI